MVSELEPCCFKCYQFPFFHLDLFCLWTQDLLQSCDVFVSSGSLPAGLYPLWLECVPDQALQSPGRSPTWGACQILLRPEALHQSHHEAEVSVRASLGVLFFFCKLNWFLFFVIIYRYGKRDNPDTVFSDVLLKESTESIPGSSYIRCMVL